MSTAEDTFAVNVYLTDGTGLYWVVRVDTDRLTVLLEDCSCPSGPLVEERIGALAADGYRVVRASS